LKRKMPMKKRRNKNFDSKRSENLRNGINYKMRTRRSHERITAKRKRTLFSSAIATNPVKNGNVWLVFVISIQNPRKAPKTFHDFVRLFYS